MVLMESCEKALCGAASDDPRIEYSIKQLLRIVDTVKKPSGATASLHLFAQYFIVRLLSFLP
jgi:hypothetical protein